MLIKRSSENLSIPVRRADSGEIDQRFHISLSNINGPRTYFDK